MKAKKTEEVGMHSVTKILDENTSEKNLIEIVEELNKDETINGILVQLPLPEQINENSIINAMVQFSNKSKKLNIPGVIFGSHYIAKEVFDKFGFLV